MEHQSAQRTAANTAVVAEFVDEFTIAAILGVAVQSLRNWRTRGGGPPYYKVKRSSKQGMVRYNPQECIDWMRTFRRQHSSE